MTSLELQPNNAALRLPLIEAASEVLAKMFEDHLNYERPTKTVQELIVANTVIYDGLSESLSEVGRD
jgi:hypothetical protein